MAGAQFYPCDLAMMCFVILALVVAIGTAAQVLRIVDDSDGSDHAMAAAGIVVGAGVFASVYYGARRMVRPASGWY